MIEQEDLREALTVIDEMIGKYFSNLGCYADRQHHMVKITANCRVCRRVFSCERSYVSPGWGKEIVNELADITLGHAKTHNKSALILPPHLASRPS